MTQRMSSRASMLMAALLTLAPGCGGDSPASTCKSGKTQSCSCNNSTAGLQTCRANGTWGPCDCSRADFGYSVGGEGATCESILNCETGLFCQSGVCVRPADGSITPTVDAGTTPVVDGPSPKPDQTPDPCAGAILDQRLNIGQSVTASKGSSKVAVKVRDIGVSGSVPAALLELDGESSNVEIVKLGKSVTSSAGFEVSVPEINNQGAAASMWARICITHP